MTYPFVMEVVSNPQPGNDDYELFDYMIDSSYNMSMISRRTIKALPRPEKCGIPEDMKPQFEALLSRLGRNHKYDSVLRDTPKSGKVRNTCLPGNGRDLLGDIHVRQHIIDENATDVSDDRTERNQKDRDATADAGGEPEHQHVYCTCSAAMAGEPCNCPHGTYGQDRE